MTLAKRVIPCLDVDLSYPNLSNNNGIVVKGKHFTNLKPVGNPVQLAAKYNQQGADELVFLDVTATTTGRDTMIDIVKNTADQIFIPLTVGGGIASVSHAEALLRSGADKISINSAAVAQPNLLEKLSHKFGSQCIVLSMDVKFLVTENRWVITTHGGQRITDLEALDWAKTAEILGVGEILLNSITTDGTQTGFDLALITAVRKVVNIPIIASGGAGAIDHFPAAIRAGADAVLAASVFHYDQITISQVKAALKNAGIPVR